VWLRELLARPAAIARRPRPAGRPKAGLVALAQRAGGPADAAARVDAARERLRRQIPPRPADD
jgi:hypothetical protein